MVFLLALAALAGDRWLPDFQQANAHFPNVHSLLQYRVTLYLHDWVGLSWHQLLATMPQCQNGSEQLPNTRASFRQRPVHLCLHLLQARAAKPRHVPHPQHGAMVSSLLYLQHWGHKAAEATLRAQVSHCLDMQPPFVGHVVAGPRSVETARMNGYEICVSQTSLVVRALTGHSFVKVDLDRTSVYTPLVTEEKHDMTRDFAFVKAKDLNAKLGIRTPSLQFLTEYTMHASYHYRWNGDKYVFYRAAGGSRRSPPNGRWPPRSSSCRLTATPSAATRRTCWTSSLTPGTRSRRHPPGYPPPKTGARPRP